jgi:hypothetical protein
MASTARYVYDAWTGRCVAPSQPACARQAPTTVPCVRLGPLIALSHGTILGRPALLLQTGKRLPTAARAVAALLLCVVARCIGFVVRICVGRLDGVVAVNLHGDAISAGFGVSRYRDKTLAFTEID